MRPFGQVQTERVQVPWTSMQAFVALGVAGGFGVAYMMYEGLKTSKMNQEERDALKNVALAGGGALLAYGIFYALDIDKKWFMAETAMEEIEKKLGLPEEATFP